MDVTGCIDKLGAVVNKLNNRRGQANRCHWIHVEPDVTLGGRAGEVFVIWQEVRAGMRGKEFAHRRSGQPSTTTVRVKRCMAAHNA